MRGKHGLFLSACLLAGLLAAPVAGGAQELEGDLKVYGQVREGDQEREREAPVVTDGELALSRLPHGTSLGTFFRLERDFATDGGVSDFYAGYIRTRAIPGLDITAGRQFLDEGTGGVFVADGGKVRLDPGWPVDFTFFGGVPRYFEPTYSSNIQSQDEILFGGNAGTRRIGNGRLSVGYLQIERDEHVLRQLVTGTATQSLSGLPATPHLYGALAYDANGKNLDLATAGLDLFLTKPRLQVNLEGTYYQPQDDDRERPLADLDRREDAIFELFSVSEMSRVRAGLNYPIRKSLSTFADYSFQHYDRQADGQRQDAHVASAGLLWLPGGDGLETVRLEYYTLKTEDDAVNGGKALYESRVYERLSFRAMIDVSYYEKINNQTDTAVNGFLGLGYELYPGLEGELSLEANHNERFDREFRFGFLITYNFRHGLGGRGRTGGES